MTVKVIKDDPPLQITGIPVTDGGTWSVAMPTGDRVGTGFTVEATNSGPEGESTVTLSDVAFGEVWVCSGQSNMEWTINGVRGALQEWSNIRNA